MDQRPHSVHQADGWRTVSGRFPDIASLRSGKRPLRGPWVDVFRTPGGEIDLRSGRFCGSSYIVVTKYAISPTGDRFRLLASGKRPPTAREVDVCRTSNWQCPETVRQPSANRPPGGRLPDDFRTLAIASAPDPHASIGAGTPTTLIRLVRKVGTHKRNIIPYGMCRTFLSPAPSPPQAGSSHTT